MRIPNPSETGHDAYDYETLFLEADAEKIRRLSAVRNAAESERRRREAVNRADRR